MAFIISQSVQIERDPTGGVHSLNHLGQPYGPLAQFPNALKLAEAYLLDVAAIYGIDSAWLKALDQRPSDAVGNVGTELRFSRQDAITGTATVSFQQTHFGLPVWQAGFTVSMLTGPLRATSSLSTLHSAIQVDKPKENARCLSGRMTPQELAKSLGVNPRTEIPISSERMWVYRYDATQRGSLAPQEKAKPTKRGGLAPDAPMALPLPPLDPSIIDGQYYVVTEVIFDLPLPPLFAHVQWRAFIDVTTCSVLYLRALMADWTGSVYLTDPITATGDTTITACSAAAILDPLRTDVTLEGLVASTPQNLTGNYVTVLQGSGPDAPPTVTPPPTGFTYSVPTPNFAAVCAYHHVDQLFRLIESFGYSPITNFFSTRTQLPLEADFLSETDVNSHFVPTTNSWKITSGQEQDSCPAASLRTGA